MTQSIAADGYTASAPESKIDREYVLSREDIAFYRENGYIHLKSVLSQ